MKRTIVTLALVTAFVFAFAAVAMATYRGFTPIRSQAELDAGYLHNFVSWGEALDEMERNGVNGELQSTAHGGYVTTTTKCATCHSAHAAPAVNPNARPGEANRGGAVNNANNAAQSFLTAGSDGCEVCHVAGGAQTSTLLVEWGPNGGGPHADPNRGCMLCHNAGIHGLASSQFNVMNVFLLGAGRNPHLPGSDNAVAGDRPAGTTMNRDQQIRAELGTTAATAQLQRGGILDVPLASPSFTTVAAPSAASTWWYDGIRGIGSEPGALPPTSVLPGGAAERGEAFAAARSLATAFTCGESGCHDSTAMFNLNWGMGFDRIEYVRDADPTFAFGSYQYGSSIEGTRTVTGHVMPSIRATGGSTQACGPCHAGNPAGFPTASTTPNPNWESGATGNAGFSLYVADDTRRAWGCDQCHDMVGVATNSTAWPHGNRNILVYEWLADGTQEENMVVAGNLWMYGGNIARSTAIGTVNSANQNTRAIFDDGGGTTFRGPTSENVSFADQSWTVLTGVTSGRYGLPGLNPSLPGYIPAATQATVTGLTDGSCLKCHVPLDAVSMTAMDAIGADALRHAWTHGGSNPVTPTWNGVTPTNSNRLFLYR